MSKKDQEDNGAIILKDQIKAASESLRALGMYVSTLQSSSEEISQEYLLVREQLSPISEGITPIDSGKANALLKTIEGETRSVNNLKRLIFSHCQELRRGLRRMVVNNDREQE